MTTRSHLRGARADWMIVDETLGFTFPEGTTYVVSDADVFVPAPPHSDALTLDECAILLGDYAVDLDDVAERLVQLRNTAGDPWVATNLQAAEDHLRQAWVYVRQAVTTLNDADKP